MEHPTEPTKQEKKPGVWRAWLFPMLKGALIGAGAILPGISGGVLCLVLGVYRPLMALLAHPIQELKKQFWFFLPVLIGFAIGVLALSKLVALLFGASAVPAVWLFIGLIAGTMPALLRESGREARTAGNWVTFAVMLVVTLAALVLMKRGVAVGEYTDLSDQLLSWLGVARGAVASQSTPGAWVWLLCGVLWGVGFIAPGMSPSSLFIFMGVYEPMSAGIAALDLSILLPMGAGLVACVLIASQGVNWLLQHAYRTTMHVILGVSVASTVAILPIGNAKSAADVAVYAACFVAGLVVALWMDRLNRKMDADKA